MDDDSYAGGSQGGDSLPAATAAADGCSRLHGNAASLSQVQADGQATFARSIHCFSHC